MNRPSRHRTGHAVVRWLMTLFGAAVVILGLVTFWLPLPVGLPLLLLGGGDPGPLFAVGTSSGRRRHPAFRRFVRRMRTLERQVGRRHAGRGTQRPASPPESD